MNSGMVFARKQISSQFRSNMHKSNYFPGLDLLRFFSAFWVMSFHYLFGLTAALSWYRFGNLGVPLFFIISGFVISYSISNKPLKQFIQGRFLRLAPIFWVICTATYIFTLLMPNGNPVRLPEYFISMTMLGDKLSSALGFGGLVDPVYWSLTVEILFYAGIGLFVYFFSWKNIRYFLWGWLLVSMAAFALHIDNTFAMKTLLVRHASYFIFGATFALIKLTEYTSEKLRNWDLALLTTTAIYSTLISYRALPPYFVINPKDTAIVTLLHPAFFIGFMLLIFYSRYITSKNALSFFMILGGITYPLYLIHQTVGRTLLNFFEGTTQHLALVGIMMVFIITVSYGAFRLDEQLRKKIALALGFKRAI